jgi:hypothetical protein
MNAATGVQHCADQWEQRVGAGDWNAKLGRPALGLVFHDAA